MGKRAKGEGTIYGPDKNGAWWAQLPAGPDGRRPRRKAASEAEALAALRELHAERAAGRDLSQKAGTVGELVEALLVTIDAHRRPGTARTYRTAARHLRHIGALKIDAVTLETVQGLADKLAKLTGPHQLRKALTILHRAYERVIPERVDRNPVQWKRLTLGKAEHQERAPAEEEDVARLLAAADDLDERGARVRLAPAWWLAALLGLRRGELAGVTWKDLDLARAELRITSQVSETEDGSHKPGQPTKTKAGVRVLPLGPQLVARLRAHQQTQAQERLRLGKGWQRHDLIICREDGTPYQLTALNYDLAVLCKAAKVPAYSPHQLRHLFATLVADEGFNESVVAALLGHERRGSVTARYVHAKPKTLRAAVEQVEARILGAAAEAARETK